MFHNIDRFQKSLSEMREDHFAEKQVLHFPIHRSLTIQALNMEIAKLNDKLFQLNAKTTSNIQSTTQVSTAPKVSYATTLFLC